MYMYLCNVPLKHCVFRFEPLTLRVVGVLPGSAGVRAILQERVPQVELMILDFHFEKTAQSWD